MTSRIPQTSHLLAPLLVAALLTGCASSTPHKATPTTPPPTTPPPLTASQAKVLATAAVATEADLPGYSAEVQTTSPSDAADDAKLKHCLGTPVIAYAASDPGRAFTKGDSEIDSSADVTSTRAQAKAEFDALASPHATACLEQAIRAGLTQGGLQVTSFSAVPLPATVTGSDVAQAYQLEVEGTSEGHGVRITGYDLMVLVGEVEMDLSTIEPKPTVTLGDLTTLAGTLVTRVKTGSPA